MKLPRKTLTIQGEPMVVCGPSADDHYFNSVGDDLDAEFTSFIQGHVSADAQCIDIGANVGIKTVQLARMASRGKVVSVEAGPGLYEALSGTIEANGLTNVQSVHAAVTDRDGGLIRFAENSAYGQISADGVEVPAVTLSSLVSTYGLAKLDFLKIDVEGFEFPILRSSLPLLKQHDTVVFFEFNSWCMLASTEDHPRHCLEWLLSTFSEVWVVRRNDKDGVAIKRALPGEAKGILAKNMIEDGLVTDLVVCMAPSRVQA